MIYNNFPSLLIELIFFLVSFVKKKIIIGSMILAITVPVVSFMSCKLENKADLPVGEVWRNLGWIDNNTYRVKATAATSKTLRNEVAKRHFAKMRAVLNAEHMVLEDFKFLTEIVRGCCCSILEIPVRTDLAREVKIIIQGGSVIEIKFDKDYNCTLIYEVKARRLKRKVIEAEFK
ncbi:MAG: hypothetical protein GY754_22200 [bacterium]|nr:hypothetical protein [bacterium]